MNKSGRVWVNTRNPCNDFIVNHLFRTRQLAFKSQNQRKAAIYSHALDAVKRYPLPIICRSQLKNLNGIGDYMCEELIALIKDHYRNYLNSNAQRTSTFDSLQ